MGLKPVLVAFTTLSLLAGTGAAAIAYNSSGAPSAQTRPTAAQSAAAAKLRKPRLPLRIHTGATSPTRPIAPRLPTRNPAGGRVALFNGLNKPGMNASDGGESVPPDTTGSIGPNHYVELVNSAIGVYNRSDLSLVGMASFNSWLNQGVGLCDPQIQWDPSSQRWLYEVLGCGFGIDTLFFGWSKTTDPSDFVNGWCEFSVNTPGLLTDYPKLGHNSHYMIVGANAFKDGPGHAFASAQIYWMNTPAAGDTSCTAPTVSSKGSAASQLLNGDGSQTATPVPVDTTTNATDGYVVAAYDATVSPPTPNKLAVFHIDGSGTFHQDSDIPVNVYAVPNPAPDFGGSTFNLDTLDGRLTQAAGDPTTGIYTQHTVDGAGGRSKVTWYEIQVVASVPKLAQEGDIASATDFVFNGSIAPASDGHGAAIFYNRSSTTIDPVIAGRVRETSTAAGQMDPGEIVLATSAGGDTDFSCNYFGSGAACRWGDYSGASPDPINPRVVWGSNEALGTPSAFPYWVTENFAVVIPPTRAVQQAPTATPPSRGGVNQSSPPPPPVGR